MTHFIMLSGWCNYAVIWADTRSMFRRPMTSSNVLSPLHEFQPELSPPPPLALTAAVDGQIVPSVARDTQPTWAFRAGNAPTRPVEWR